MANISAIKLPDGVTYNIKDNSSGYITGMTILSYGSSTWNDFITAYNANKVVYCRASSNSNPASGSQTRLAFMAYVNNATTPTNVEFQYYRSVSSHTASQQGDQVYVYKLDKTSGWSVTTREASVKVVAGTGLGGTYSNGTMTLTGPTKVSDLTNDSGFITGYTETDPIFSASAAAEIASSDITNWNGKQAALVSGTNIKTINGQSLLGSGDLPVAPPVTSTDVPTADTISEFDSDAHMNSTDMTTAQVDDFVDGLNVSGGGVVKTNVTPTSGTNYSGYGNCYYEVLGKLVHFHIGIGGLTANTTTKIYTMPSGLRPQTKIFAKGGGGSSLNYSGVELWENGEIYVTSQGTYCGGELWYFV